MPECGRKAVAHHLCQKHYKRWVNNGDPEITIYTERGKAREWLLQVAAPCTSKECLEWPFNRMSVGYGKVWVDGAYAGAHREVCLVVKGPPPFEGAEAAHECGNRGCVNPNHINWKTRASNADDRKAHGTASVHAGAKHKPRTLLTDPEVAAVRASESPGVELAAVLNVDPSMISKIRHGHRRSST